MPTHDETEHFWRDYDALTEIRPFDTLAIQSRRLPVPLGQIHGLPRQRRRDGHDEVPSAPVPGERRG